MGDYPPTNYPLEKGFRIWFRILQVGGQNFKKPSTFVGTSANLALNLPIDSMS